MTTTEQTSMRTSASALCEDDRALGWTLALAGGEGVRMQSYLAQRFGQCVPKQYCRMLGTRSMIEHTLDRLRPLTPPSRTLTVIGTTHREVAMPQLAGRSDHVFCQPASRDTGLALYVALAMIKRWQPEAIVTITPTDHYVAPADAYVEAVRTARRVASVLTDTIVLLGANPTEPDPELGYITLGEPLTDVPQVHRVASFVEKPNVAIAQGLRANGALWSTMVACGSVSALWELGRAAEPHLLDILDSLVPLIGTPDENDAIDYIYRAYPAGQLLARHVRARARADGGDGARWRRVERLGPPRARRDDPRAAPHARDGDPPYRAVAGDVLARATALAARVGSASAT